MSERLYNMVSISGGKDSTAMLHMMLERNIPIDKVIYYQCDWDWPQLVAHLKLIERKTGLNIVRIRYYRHYEELLRLYGWPATAGGWCVRAKIDALRKYMQRAVGKHAQKIEYIGFNADEAERSVRKKVQSKKWEVRFPLVEYGVGSKEALEYCKSLGYHWDGLYDIFDRVSCFCCPKAGKIRRKQVKLYYPELYREWRRLDKIAGTEKAIVEINKPF